MENTVEVKFAQRLASNKKKERDRSLKNLKKYIAVRSAKTDFSQDELMKLLKGLHYSMWMQDKPLLQEELSNKIATLMDAFTSPHAALKFAACFFATEAREWKCLDQLRMDKFMMLVRDMLHQTFKVAQRAGWEASAASVAEMIKEEVMRPDKEEVADSLRLHLADIYLDELRTVGAEQLTGHQIGILLGPFYHFIQASRRLHITDHVIHRTFGSILRQAECESKARKKSQQIRPAQGKIPPKQPSQLNYSYRNITNTLFDLARASPCSSKVRRKIYQLVRMFCNTLGSSVPITLEDSAAPTDVSPVNGSINAGANTNKSGNTTWQAGVPVPVQQGITNAVKLTEPSVQPLRGIQQQSGSPEQHQVDGKAIRMKRKQPDPLQPQSSPVQQRSSQTDKKSVRRRRKANLVQQQSSPVQQQSSPVQQQSSPVQHQSSLTNKQKVSRKRKRSLSGDGLKKTAPLASDHSTPLHQPLEVKAQKLGSEKKQVIFNLDKNSSRELQDFLESGARTLSTPVPAVSPKPGILKPSPCVPSPKRRKLTSGSNSPSKARGGKSLSLEERAESVMRQITVARKLSRFEAKKQKQKIKKPRHH